MRSLMLIDIDALLDTRTGALFEIDPVEAVNILNKGWRDRPSDTLDNYSDVISTKQYLDAYESRSKYTLSISRPTNILKIMAPEMLNMALSAGTPNSGVEDFCLIVNTYPYQFTEAEAEAIQQSVSETVGEGVPVRLVSYLPDSTRLSYLEMRGITDYITYDINGWLMREFGDITKAEEFISAPTVSIWGPSLMVADGAYTTMLSEEPDLSPKDDPWDFLKVALAPFVNLNWIDVGAISLLS